MKTKFKLGLLGNNISRSRSKNLHELIGEMYQLEVGYTLMDLAGKNDVSIHKELLRCQHEGFDGVNVTHPYKRDAFKCVKVLPGFPQGLTSVNTVLFHSKDLLADNTDYSGFCQAYRTQLDASPGKVLMLGAGGVGLAIAFGLLSLGASELIVHDNHPESTESLISYFKDTDFTVRPAGSDLVAEMQAADGLINATPIGMFQYPGNPFPIEGFAQQRWAFDAIYTPENTEFLKQCRTRNIPTISGFKLFLYQGLDAFHRFTGIQVDGHHVEQEFLRRHPLEN